MRLATAEEYQEYWQTARFWFVAHFPKDDYRCIGAVAEYLANRDKISLYDQSLRKIDNE